MRIEIRLKEALESIGRDKHGITQMLANDLKIHRHTIGRIYNSKMRNPPLDVLELICDWLIEHGFPADRLPQALFGAQPAKLWDALLTMVQLTLYLGEYQRVEERIAAKLWISRRDASVASHVIERLSMPNAHGPAAKPVPHFEYVPFHFGAENPQVAEKQFVADKKNALRIFEEMRLRPPKQAAVMIGSQKVNYVTEYFIADLFGAEPFTTPTDRPRVPFFLVYRPFDRQMSSCCAGTKLPDRADGSKPGIYYRDRGGKWVECRWVADAHDAGITIVTYDPRTMGIEIATLGLSGIATATIGSQLVRNGHRFWPATNAESQGRKVAVFISRMVFQQEGSEGNDETLRLKSFDVIPMGEDTLRKYLRR